MSDIAPGQSVTKFTPHKIALILFTLHQFIVMSTRI